MLPPLKRPLIPPNYPASLFTNGATTRRGHIADTTPPCTPGKRYFKGVVNLPNACIWKEIKQTLKLPPARTSDPASERLFGPLNENYLDSALSPGRRKVVERTIH